MIKRSLDFLLALFFLIILVPLFIIIMVLIKLDSPGVALFKQERIGKDGKPFGIFKFRSMVQNAAQQGPYYTSQNDARITRVGKFLRKTSLDELPQCINVLRGEMSFVGPRPDVASQRDLYTEAEWQQRCQVRPGITGWAQALFRSQATLEQRKSYDLQYVEKQSLWLDCKIIALTVRQVLLKGGY